MPSLFYKCSNCGFKQLINPPDINNKPIITCPVCNSDIIYSKQIEVAWMNEVDEQGNCKQIEFKGIDEQDCLSKACNYFECEPQELDYYIVKSKGIFSSLVIRAWKYTDNLDSNAIKIITNNSNANGWIAIDRINKIVYIPSNAIHSLSNIGIEYNKILSLKCNELSGSINCELVLEPYNKLKFVFYPKQRDNVDKLIDILYNDLPQFKNDMYTICFFKKCDIPDNRKICHIKIDNIDADLGDSCFVWKDDKSLCICNTVVRNGIKIEIDNIQYYRLMGDKYITTEVIGGGGGGLSIKGALIGGLVAGEAGAIIGSRKSIEPIKNNSIMHDKQTVSMYNKDLSIILKFNSKVYDILLDLLPDKEYESIIHNTKVSLPNTAAGTTDIKFQLKELKSMFKEELITEEEYNSKRQELLSKVQ